DDVVRHHRVADRRRVAADLPARLGDDLALVPVLVVVESRVVPLVSLARHERQVLLLTDAAHEDRDRATAWRLRAGVLPRLLDDAHAIHEAIDAFLGREERHVENLVLVLIPSRADAEDQPPSTEQIDRGGLPREDGP